MHRNWKKKINDAQCPYLYIGEVGLQHIGAGIAGIKEHELCFFQVIGWQSFLHVGCNWLRKKILFLRTNHLPTTRNLEAHQAAVGILEGNGSGHGIKSLTCCRLLKMPTACQKWPNVMARMHNSVAESWLLGGEDVPLLEVLVLSIWSLVAKETNVPNTCYTTHHKSFFFFTITVLFILPSILCSSH